jgi:hypothetical protein
MKSTAVVSVLLPADKIGSQVLKQQYSKERRTPIIIQKNLLLMIDQKRQIWLLLQLNHPDICKTQLKLMHNEKYVNPKNIKSLQDYGVLIWHHQLLLLKLF